MKDRITNTITRHIGVISESSRGWKLELNGSAACPSFSDGPHDEECSF